tara:strand:+ start:546 stop:8201 length:7656 start_codon:yes stop_codon:yes gene_type:complete
MIDKITPRALDKSSDDKLIAKTSMRDALNLYITDDASDSEGNVGVLKNIKGNLNIAYADPVQDPPTSLNSFLKVIGSVTDDKTQICYFFVWSQNPKDHGIWAYDKYGKLPLSESDPIGVENSLRKIFTSSQFNFPEHGFVKGDIVYTNTNEFEKHKQIEAYLANNEGLKVDFEKDILIYFTDHKNEPRKINAYRALLEKNQAILSYDLYDTADFICACPKVPLERITFEFSPDAERSTNNFAATPGFQFAYQNIYKDGVESAISTYSVMAFPPSVLHRGAAQTSNILSHNLCTLTIPPAGPEIKNIRILARYGNTANFFEIDEVSNTTSETENWDISSRTYRFYNDRVASGVSPKEVDKTFDNLPRKAQAQTAISNRLVYGNYLEGYDNVNTECTSKVIYNERPQDFLDLTLRAHPSIEPLSANNDNKCVGFQIDTTEIPAKIAAGTLIQVNLDYTPDRNFHIYQADETKREYGSYHQSRQMGKYSSNAVGYRHWPLTDQNNFYYEEGESNSNTGANNTHENTPADLQEKGVGGSTGQQDSWKNQNDSGGRFLKARGEMFFGQNFGVGSVNDFTGANLPKWRVTNLDGVNDEPILTEGNYVRYGTSAGNPLILKSVPLRFSVKFKLLLDIIYDGKKLVEETITEALAGANGTSVADGGTGVFSWNNWIEIDTENDVTNTVKVTKSDYDLGLGYPTGDGEGPYDPNFDFKKIMPGDDLSYLICGVGSVGDQTTRDEPQGDEFYGFGVQDRNYIVPFGYFIINRAEVDFYLELVDSTLHSGSRKHLRLAISKIDVEPEDGLPGVMTCFKRLDPTSPWWAIDPITIQQPDFHGDFNTANYYNTSSTVSLELQEEWLNSVAYKFRLPDPFFFEGAYGSFFPKKQFTCNFDYSNSANNFTLDGGGVSGDRWVNIGFCGWLDSSQPGYEFYKPHNPDGDYVPKLGPDGQKFKFSIMDGEGGPGGSHAGANSAYDKHGNSKYGSIAARVDFGFDGSQVRMGKGDFSATYPAFVGGSTEPLSVNNIGTTPIGTGNSDVAAALGLTVDYDPDNPDNDNDGNIWDLWRDRYVVSGPFFTGSIQMNPIVGFPSNAANPQPFPDVRDFTTTLPLVWVNSEGNRLNDNEPIPKNWLKTSYPWPQVFRPTSPQSFTDSQGLITNGQLDLTPFSNPEYYTDYGDESTLTDIDNIGDSPPATDKFGSVDFSLTHSAIEGNTRSSFVSGEQVGHMSFKSSATHEFGIVYYDQRGRHGYVNHLDTVYVEGYSPQSRLSDNLGNNNQGSAHVELTLLHTPPSWAHNYKIVYSKNTSVSDFIQYSAGGAFTAEGESSGGDPSRIYVSLNYLQGHPISYSSAWGARSKEGGMAIYTPQDGDRLRVISYMLPPGGTPVPERIYPQNYDFEVSSVVSLDDSDDNPLAIQTDGDYVIPENRQGLFLVIKNNDAANGFRYQDVRDDTHNWKNNCLMEIYSPVKDLDSDDRLYYEIGDTHNIVKLPNGTLVHEQPQILLTEGDVYFRSAAVNFRDYDDSILDGGLLGYEDIIIDTEADIEASDFNEFKASESNFKSYYIESPVGTDLFKSDSLSVGRPNIIKHDAQEAYKEASVIHSDKDVTNAGKVSYSSFNRSIPIDQDLDLKSGPINYLVNHDENCLFIQRSKTGHIPIDRSIISDVSGESSLIASSKFLNPPRYYAGWAGAGGNPESVVSIDNTVYFANKSLGEVYKVSGANGVNVISEKNMKSYFRDLFKNAIDKSRINGDDVRVVGGYDPLKNEYLITVLDPETYGLSTLPDFPHQPDAKTSEMVFGCMDPFALNYDSRATHSDRTCKYPDPPYEPFTGNICDYPALFNEFGILDIETANEAYRDVQERLLLDPKDDNYLTEYKASLIFPDFDNSGTLNDQDLIIATEPPYIGATCIEFSTLPRVELSWVSAGAFEDGPGSWTALFKPNSFQGEGVLNGGEIIEASPFKSLKVQTFNFDKLEENQKITLSLQMGQEIYDHIVSTDTNGDGIYNQPTGGTIFSEFSMRPYNTLALDTPILGGALNFNWLFGVVYTGLEELDEDLQYGSDASINQDGVQGFEIQFSKSYIQTATPENNTDYFYVNFNFPADPETGNWLGNEGSIGSPMSFDAYPEFHTQVLNTEIVYEHISLPDKTQTCDLKGYISWQAAGSSSEAKLITEPLLFTGNICDYPAMIDWHNQYNNGRFTIGSIFDYYQHVITRIIQSNITDIQATYEFPNFPGASINPIPGESNPLYPIIPNTGMSQENWLEYFNENNGLGNLALNSDDPTLPFYGGSAIANFAWPDGDATYFPESLFNLPGFYGNDMFALRAWLLYAMANIYTQEQLEGYQSPSGIWIPTVNSICPPPPPTTLQYNNNPCDYPALFDNAGFITPESMAAAYGNTLQDIANGDLTSEDATWIFPDVNGDGIIQIQDLIGVILDFPVPCGPPPPSINWCDYPLIIDNDPDSPFYGFITFQSMQYGHKWAVTNVGDGVWTTSEALLYFPDLIGDGVFQYIPYFLLILQFEGDGTLPIDCSELGEPGNIKPTTIAKLRALEENKRNKNETNGGNYAI